jgi:shikimate dehydrogenase
MDINATTKINLIIGDPISHSLSPAMHNLAYRFMGIYGEFIYLAAHVLPQDLQKAITGLRAINVNGITCTIPHKVEVIRLIDELSEDAQKIGAVNTIKNNNGKLIGYNTDWLGILRPLENKLKSLKEVNIGLIGAGGAARAVAFAVQKAGANLMVFNRTVSEGKRLAKEFGGKGFGLNEISKISECKIIINSTSAGMGELQNISLVPKELITSDMIVFDNVYNPAETKLIIDAKEKGAGIIYGYEMLLHQALAQFEIFTRQKAPEKIMHDFLIKYLFNN